MHLAVEIYGQVWISQGGRALFSCEKEIEAVQLMIALHSLTVTNTPYRLHVRHRISYTGFSISHDQSLRMTNCLLPGEVLNSTQWTYLADWPPTVKATKVVMCQLDPSRFPVPLYHLFLRRTGLR